MNRVRIKFCGITRPADALCAVELGADAVGLNFYRGSQRCVDFETAGEIISVLPPFISKVGLFVNQDEDEIRMIINGLPLDYLQFHGDESPQDCSRYDKPYIKSIKMTDTVDLVLESGKYHQCAGLLLDAYVEGMAGGTGQKFDWARVPSVLTRPVILAGGLTPENVKAAVIQVKPFAVDVSSGVESSPGIKDPDKMAAFVNEVTRLWKR